MEISPQRQLSPEELAMQGICKQLFKSRIFRGFYEQRCYVDAINTYRDVVVLQRSERELEKLLLQTKEKLTIIYQRACLGMWIGFSTAHSGSFANLPKRHTAAHPSLLKTCIWTELSDLAFGEYWFTIKTLRFRNEEVLLKLKMLRAVETTEAPLITANLRLIESIEQSTAVAHTTIQDSNASNDIPTSVQLQITFNDFVSLFRQWGESIKITTYQFLANDINKANILGMFKFVALLVASILVGAVYAVKFLGIFMLRLMFELSRFTHFATPIFLKVIDMLNKCIGGIFILFTMLWKDWINRDMSKKQRIISNNALTYSSYLNEDAQIERRN